MAAFGPGAVSVWLSVATFPGACLIVLAVFVQFCPVLIVLLTHSRLRARPDKAADTLRNCACIWAAVATVLALWEGLKPSLGAQLATLIEIHVPAALVFVVCRTWTPVNIRGSLIFMQYGTVLLL